MRKKLSKTAVFFLAFLVLVVAGFFASKFKSAAEVPPAFEQARMDGAVTAQDIVNLSNQLVTDLNEVNRMDSQGNTREALSLTVGLLQKSNDVRGLAVKLSDQLGKMTTALSGVKSTDARAAALESISDRLALINKLINYSDELAQLAEVLQHKFIGTYDARKVPALVSQINGEVTAINNFNRLAGAAMDKFDQIIKGAN